MVKQADVVVFVARRVSADDGTLSDAHGDPCKPFANRKLLRLSVADRLQQSVCCTMFTDF
jgi:hypothetical protein